MTDTVGFFSLFLPSGAVFSDTADIYASIPVSGNEELVLSAVYPYLAKKNADELLARTKTIYAAVSPQNASFKIAAQGNFPKSFAPLVFSRSSGWIKKQSDSKILPSALMTYFEANAGITIQAAIPYSGLAFVSTSGMQTMLERAAVNEPSASVDAAVLRVFERASASDVRFFVPNPQPLLQMFLGDGLTLPVEYAAGICSPLTENGKLARYDADIYLKLRDPRFIRPSLVLLQSILLLFPDTRIHAGTDSDILIEGFPLDVSVFSFFLPG